MQATLYSPDTHSIDCEHIDPDALFVLDKLCQAGYTAYLVGGSVRDLLLGITPKDFDISTSAKPEEVKELFKRNCLMIGRRFRLAHVRFGKKIFEVSTFRAGDNEADHLIVRDNEWGSPEEDVLRRDFTINGLFFDHSKKQVIDYVGGFQDIQSKTLRTIGDPKKRFKQDPVRMIRLLKFIARLGFNADIDSMEALSICKEEILKSAPARLLEELLRMLESGHSVPFLHLMINHGFLDLLVPTLSSQLQKEEKEEVFNLLRLVDASNKHEDKKLRRSVLFSCLLFPIAKKTIQKELLDHDENPHYGKIQTVIMELLQRCTNEDTIRLPKRLRTSIDFILNAQFRFTPLHPKRSFRKRRFLQQAEISSGLQFFSLRAQKDPSLEAKYQHWKELCSQRKKHSPKEKRRFYGRSRATPS